MGRKVEKGGDRGMGLENILSKFESLDRYDRWDAAGDDFIWRDQRWQSVVSLYFDLN
jgi:hypothetical protein